ncbi:MAG: hypothetical protein N4A46_03510 [Schleiferiaceae bacterium]|nr:hypothetical protein [Schleiferiaceae bacterium]
MSKNTGCNPEILGLLAGKSSTKQLVFRQTKEVFMEFKKLLKTIAKELNDNICQIDKQVIVEFIDAGEYEAEIRFSGDALIFHMHTNAFTFDKSHFTHQNSYIKNEPLNGYFGLISMYNFLADSLRYNRVNDMGHLVGRLFVNREKHFFVDGKRQFAFMYNDPANDLVTEDLLRDVIEKTIVYALDFDLTSPNFNDVRIVTVNQIRSISNELKISTSKKLGVKMSSDTDNHPR